MDQPPDYPNPAEDPDDPDIFFDENQGNGKILISDGNNLLSGELEDDIRGPMEIAAAIAVEQAEQAAREAQEAAREAQEAARELDEARRRQLVAVLPANPSVQEMIATLRPETITVLNQLLTSCCREFPTINLLIFRPTATFESAALTATEHVSRCQWQSPAELPASR